MLPQILKDSRFHSFQQKAKSAESGNYQKAPILLLVCLNDQGLPDKEEDYHIKIDATQEERGRIREETNEILKKEEDRIVAKFVV